MKKFLVTAILLLAVHLNAENDSILSGEQLSTPTLWLFAPEMFACNLTNIDEKSHQVQVRIISNGKVLLKSKILMLEPKHTTNHKIQGLPEGGPLYCEFTVEETKEMYRGVAVLFHGPKGSDYVAVPAQ